MNWLHYSFLASIVGSVWSLSVKHGLHSIFVTDYASWYSIIAGLVLSLVQSARGIPFLLDKWSLLSGVAQSAAALCVAKSINLAPNPGSTVGIFRSQSILTAILAYFVFGSSLSLDRMIAMVVVVLGVITLSHSTNKEPFTNQTNPPGNLPGKYQWVTLAVIAGIAMSVKDIFTKKAFINSPISPTNVTWNAIIIQSVILLAYDRYTTGTFHLQDQNGDNRINQKDWYIVIWTGFAYCAYIFTVVIATKSAPNVGYVKSIIILSALFTTIGAHYLYGSPITKTSLVGIMMIVSGVAYISL